MLQVTDSLNEGAVKEECDLNSQHGWSIRAAKPTVIDNMCSQFIILDISDRQGFKFPLRECPTLTTHDTGQIYAQRSEMYTIGAILRMSGRRR